MEQIVVAAGPQTFDPVVDLAERRQDQGRSLNSLSPQRADQRKTVSFREHSVHDQDVVLTVNRHGQPVVAIRSRIGDMPDFTERFDQVVRGVAVVLNDQ